MVGFLSALTPYFTKNPHKNEYFRYIENTFYDHIQSGGDESKNLINFSIDLKNEKRY